MIYSRDDEGNGFNPVYYSPSKGLFKDRDYIPFSSLDDDDQVNAQTLNNYAYSLAERGVSLNKAKSMAEKAITIEPENGAYLDTIGWIHFKLGNMSKAHNYIKKAVKLDDTNAVVLEHLGDVLIQKNKINEARDIYKQAYELDPDNLELKTKAGE